MNWMDKVGKTEPGKGQIAVFWLGQAGFLLKADTGHTIAIDPYLSEYVAHLFPDMAPGFKRLMPPPCGAEDLCVDSLLISHDHGDHFDVESIRAMMQNGHTRVYTNTIVAEMMEKMDLDMERVTVLKKGDIVPLFSGCVMTAADADHGDLAPEALGFLLRFGEKAVYFAGDTALTLERMTVPLQAKPDIALLPINGAFGNLNGVQAAQYAQMLGCKVLIPCHFWTFPLHHGDPQELIDAMPREAPDVSLHLLCQGEAYIG